MNELYRAPFQESAFYHVFARSNNQELIFRSDENRRYFLQKFDEYLSDYLFVYAYCLMDNHVHFLIRTKSGLSHNDELSDQITEQFRRFFISYSMSFNKQQDRKGNLFQRPFKRVLIQNEDYFTTLIAYIHCNPTKHLNHSFERWQWSSYNRILAGFSTKIPKNEVLDWFGGKEQFVNFHRGYCESYLSKDFWLED